MLPPYCSLVTIRGLNTVGCTVVYWNALTSIKCCSQSRWAGENTQSSIHSRIVEIYFSKWRKNGVSSLARFVRIPNQRWQLLVRLAHSDFLFDCYMRYTNTLMYVCMYVVEVPLSHVRAPTHAALTIVCYATVCMPYMVPGPCTANRNGSMTVTGVDFDYQLWCFIINNQFNGSKFSWPIP